VRENVDGHLRYRETVEWSSASPGPSSSNSDAVEIVYYRRVSLVEEVRTCPYVAERSIWRASGMGAACG